MGAHPRIGDTERQGAMAELARHYAEGRLDLAEYNERLDAVGSAKVMPDIWQVFVDLPHPSRSLAAVHSPAVMALTPGQRQRGAVVPQRRGRLGGPVLIGLLLLAVVLGVGLGMLEVSGIALVALVVVAWLIGRRSGAARNVRGGPGPR